MANTPAGRKHEINAALRTIFRAAEKIGVDGSLYIVVAVGSFSAITVGRADPYAVALLTTVVLGGWTGNKVANDAMLERRERRALEDLRQTEGEELLESHRERQRRLPTGDPHSAVKENTDGDDVDG